MPSRTMYCRVPASLYYLTPIRSLVQAFCIDVLESEGFEDQVYQLQLAVSELCTNIIKHAYRDREAEMLELVATGSPSQVVLEFWDTGNAFERTPPALPELEKLAEGGYGSYLIQQCVDDVRYERDGDRNFWRLEKVFDQRGGE